MEPQMKFILKIGFDLGLGYNEIMNMTMMDFERIHEVWKYTMETRIEEKMAFTQELIKLAYKMFAMLAIWIVNPFMGKNKGYKMEDLIDVERMDNPEKVEEEKKKKEELKSMSKEDKKKYVDDVANIFDPNDLM
jgi:amino acid permease